MLAWLRALWNWLCAQWAWAFARRIRLNNSSVDVGPVLAEGGFGSVSVLLEDGNTRWYEVRP